MDGNTFPRQTELASDSVLPATRYQSLVIFLIIGHQLGTQGNIVEETTSGDREYVKSTKTRPKYLHFFTTNVRRAASLSIR